MQSKDPLFQTPDPTELKNDNAQNLVDEGILDEKIEQGDLDLDPDTESTLTDAEHADLNQIIHTNLSAG